MSKLAREHLKGFQIKRLNHKERLANIGMLARMNMQEQQFARTHRLDHYESPEATQKFLADTYAGVVESVQRKRNRRGGNPGGERNRARSCVLLTPTLT